MPGKFPGRLQQLWRGINPGRFLKWQIFPVVSVEQWLMIKGVYLAGAAMHKQKDNSASFRFVMRSLRRQRVFFSRRRNTGKTVQRKATQSECGQAESITS
jgi:hypothetical protein